MKKKLFSLPESFLIFLKGLFMGSADIIPGVSGGTIAFITGIYEHFIYALKSINIRFIYYFISSFFNQSDRLKAKNSFLSIDFKFLIPLGLGVAVAFLSLANILGFALEQIPSYTYAFFFGLILASSVFIYLNYKKVFQPWYFLIFVCIGALISFFIVGLDTIQASEPSLIMIFFAGIISFCAMILPGLSGAFILYMLGQYEFLLNEVLREITHFSFDNVFYGISYVLGGLVGLLGFSRVISYLFKKYRMPTLSFILGLMIGALRKPGEYIYENPDNLLFTLLSVLLGIAIVGFFSYYELIIKRKKSLS
jgi:putative membrane protein